MNFPGGTSNKILEKLNRIIKEQSDELIVHVRSNDLTNNVNLLINVKRIFNKVCNRHPSRFHVSLPAKTRLTSRKP